MRMSVGIEVLHLVLRDERLLDFVLRPESMLELIPGAEVSQLHLHHRARIARRVVMIFHHLAEIAVEEDDHAFS